MGYRRLAREAALGFLYQNDLQLSCSTQTPLPFASHFQIPETYRSFFFDIVQGVADRQAEIDAEIENVADHWKLSRMERVDRAILRMATWELIESDRTPYRVVLDEAVEIAKKFSTTESASFVNGLLDRIARKHRADFKAEPEIEDVKESSSC